MGWPQPLHRCGSWSDNKASIAATRDAYDAERDSCHTPCDIARKVSTNLLKIGDLKVISRTSVMSSLRFSNGRTAIDLSILCAEARGKRKKPAAAETTTPVAISITKLRRNAAIGNTIARRLSPGDAKKPLIKRDSDASRIAIIT